MRVAFAVDTLKPPLTGIGRYVYELAMRLPGQGVGVQPVVGGRLLDADAWSSRLARAQGDAFSENKLDAIARFFDRDASIGRIGQSAFHHVTRLRPLSRKIADVAHGPNYYFPSTRGVPRVVTFHDLSAIRFPQWHLPGRAARIAQAMYQMARSVECIIADSEAIRGEVLDVFKRSEDDVITVPLGVDDSYRPRGDDEIRIALGRRGLRPRGYVLFVGTIEPRKNIVQLAAAYANLPQAIRKEFPLVVAGTRGWHDEAIFAAMATGLEAGWLRYFGYVGQGELPELFAGARCFAYPSEYEGFGLPVLEAMASGIPVLTSAHGALAELAGDAALLVAPNDVNGLSAALRAIVEDGAFRAQAVNLGLVRAAQFTWTKCAAATVSAYARVRG